MQWYDDQFEVDPNTFEASRRYPRYNRFKQEVLASWYYEGCYNEPPGN